MTFPIHEVTITLDELTKASTGQPVDVMTDKDMVVSFVADGVYEETPGRNGVELIPINEFMVNELMNLGHTGWAPKRSPYVFSIHLAKN